jgi:hypothetical protein
VFASIIRFSISKVLVDLRLAISYLWLLDATRKRYDDLIAQGFRDAKWLREGILCFAARVMVAILE